MPVLQNFTIFYKLSDNKISSLVLYDSHILYKENLCILTRLQLTQNIIL